MNVSLKSIRVHRTVGLASLELTVDGRTVQAYPSETVATVLLALGQRTFRHTSRQQAPRGLFCGMGICFDCLVTVDGQPNVRACLTPVQAGMVVQTEGSGDV